MGDGPIYDERISELNGDLEEALEIADWKVTDMFTVNDIFMDNDQKVDQHKKWTFYGLGATKYYVGLDVGSDFFAPKKFYADYVNEISVSYLQTFNLYSKPLNRESAFLNPIDGHFRG